MKNNTDLITLQDVKSGKPLPWKDKKVKSMKVEQSLVRLNMLGRAERMHYCGEYLKFAECPDGHHKQLVGANFCRDRLCPMCSWRRSRLLFGQIITMLHHVQITQPKLRYIFLTLTVKNVSGDELPQAIKDMFKAFNLMFKYKEIDQYLVGWIRNLEVTYNQKDDTYHPHFHILMAFSSHYFATGYIKQDEWTSYWRKALKVDYTPIVNVQAVKPRKKGEDTLNGAIAETAKYSVKDTDYIKDDPVLMDKIIAVLALALKGKRLIGFGKLFKTVRAELELKDIEADDVDLVDATKHECQCPICNSTLITQLYRWNYSTSDYVKRSDLHD